MKRLLCSLLAGTVLTLAAAPAARAADKPYQPRSMNTLTYTRDIAPLMFKHCAACHRPAEVAPFSLLTFRDVRKRARLIVDVTASRLMPPWKAVAGHGEFRGERRLTTDEIGMLKQWADEGTAEGDARDLPPPPSFTAGWQLGKPDLVVTMPRAYAVPAEGRDIYRNFVIPLDIPAGKYIRAVEYRPSNRRVVHHAILSLDATGKLRALDGKDGAPGFTRVGLSGGIFPGNTGFWVPGMTPRALPEGVALAWPKGADFVLQLHLHPSGKAESEQSTIGFYFTEQRPNASLNGFILSANHGINIAPGDRAYKTRATRTLTSDCRIYGIFAHMHLIGKEAKVTALLPDGSRKSLLWIDQWDFNWQLYYEYAKPVFLPKGTEIVMENVHDNSADNPANPFQPPRRIVAGEQSTNEMSAVFMHTLSEPGRRVAANSPPAGERPPSATTALDLARKAILRFDKDGDGKLSVAEIRAIPAAAHQDIEALVRRFDRNGDGKLDAAELAEAIRVLRQP